MVLNSPLRRPILPILIVLFFLASLTATGIAWWTTAKVEENRLRESFFLDSNNAHRWLSDRLLNYSYLFGGIRAFVDAGEGLFFSHFVEFFLIDKKPATAPDNFSGTITSFGMLFSE